MTKIATLLQYSPLQWHSPGHVSVVVHLLGLRNKTGNLGLCIQGYIGQRAENYMKCLAWQGSHMCTVEGFLLAAALEGPRLHTRRFAQHDFQFEDWKPFYSSFALDGQVSTFPCSGQNHVQCSIAQASIR